MHRTPTLARSSQHACELGIDPVALAGDHSLCWMRDPDGHGAPAHECGESSVQGHRAQRIEMLLLHEFHARKFLLPDKLTQRERERQNKRQQAAATGEDAESIEEVKAGKLQPSLGMLNALCYSCSSVLTVPLGGSECLSLHLFASTAGIIYPASDTIMPRVWLQVVVMRSVCACQEAGRARRSMREGWSWSRRRGCTPASCCCWTSTRCTPPSSRSTTSASPPCSAPGTTAFPRCQSLLRTWPFCPRHATSEESLALVHDLQLLCTFSYGASKRQAGLW